MTPAKTPVRTRFAPSPSGYLHIGGARTALYNYLFAKKHGGQFILRIEDTDRERSTPEAVQAILDGLSWLGLRWDEGPFFQTQRLAHYNKAIDQLVALGKAYPCFCAPAELEEKRMAALENKIKYKYDRTCFALTPQKVQEKLASETPHVIRFYSPDEESIKLNDHIKGTVVVDAKELDDLILRRTDGFPTYNLTVVVDDHDMHITHVIRGDDHLNNAFRQIQLYKALGYPIPEFAHLPLILGPDKKRLSKRHGATSVMAYKDLGYLPHTLVNYLMRLGWSYKDQELFTVEEMIAAFSLEGCSAGAGIFNPEKMLWMNGHYIRQSAPEKLSPLVKDILGSQGIKDIDDTKLLNAVTASREKVKTLTEMAAFIKLFFADVPSESETIAKVITEEVKPFLKEFAALLEKSASVERDDVHKLFEKVMTTFGVKMGQVAGPARAAISGLNISPSVYDLIKIFGKEESVRRIKSCL